MKISIIHPSRCRAKQAKATYDSWKSKCDNADNIYWLLSIDISDASHIDYLKLFEDREEIFIAHNHNAVEAINKAAIHAYSYADLFIVVSDDFDCPEHWDTLLLNALEGKQDFLVKTQDGIQKTLITLPIMDRTYYNRFGYIYNPTYEHMFCDQELTAVGHMLDKVITLPFMFPHNHYSTGRNVRDEVSIRADATWNKGEQTFKERLSNNFGLTNIVKPYSSIQWR